MKKILIILAAAIATGADTMAAPVSPEEALSRAVTTSAARLGAKAGGYTLRHTCKTDGRNAVYLFESPAADGFIMAPADDALPAVLGYGKAEICDETGNFAPGFEYWLGYMTRQVAYAAEHPDNVRPRREQAEREPIEPLCDTRWNQSYPYNKFCPTVDERRSVTGCVATAMAQVMKYHNWPETGNGYNEYSWQGQTLSMDFFSQEFNWDQMLNEYLNVFDGTAMRIDATEEQQDAVALLMQAAGYSVNMGYSPEASGAVSMRIAQSLGEYFRYDRSLRYLQRDFYTLEDWEEIIYNSLKEDGPVIYDGQANIGGHSFVCDGYEREGYFHFNWGWGGMSDGYFLLDALDPINQGIGGADSGFNYMQDIIVNIRPDRTGDSVWSPIMVCSGGLTAQYTRKTGIVKITSMLYNAGPGEIETGYIGVRFTDRINENTEPEYVIFQFEELPVMYGFNSLEFELPQLQPGQYDMTPVYTTVADEDAEFKTVATPLGATASYSFLYTDSGKALGFAPTEDFRASAIDSVTDDPNLEEIGSDCEYFTLQGVRCAGKAAGQPRPDLPAGIYIIKSGSETDKIIVR